MKSLIPVLTILILSVSCVQQAPEADPLTEPVRDSLVMLPDSLITFITQEGLETGTCVIYQQKQGIYYIFNDSLANDRRLPASTFKVFNSLVALETGVLHSADDTLRWDGEKRWSDEWNRDHDLRSAIKYSVVWYYQELARRIGEKRMQYWIDTVSYGNRDISGGIDQFWLDGGLRISAREQVDFLDRLQRNELPFSQKNIDIVKDIMILAEDSSSTFRGKTGWAQDDNTNTGWFIGYLQQADGDVMVFATMAIADNPPPPDFAQARFRITQRFLGYLE